MLFKGNCTALVTPFTSRKKVNFAVLEKLIEKQIEAKTSAILVLGTTGESSTLSIEEKIEIVKCAKRVVNGKIPLIVGSGSNNTKEAISLSQLFQSLGADALLSITPYYNKATQNGLFLHFEQIAKNVDLPIILYNVPSRTGVNMTAETTTKLSKIYNIVGIKEASGNLVQMSKIIKNTAKDFCVYSGDDSLTLPALSLGACGVFSVAANLYPQKINKMCESFFDGNINNALKIHNKLLEVFETLFCEVNPIPVKTALNILGENVGGFRLPLCHMSIKNRNKLKKEIKKVDLC